jgi:hypothetical protein
MIKVEARRKGSYAGMQLQGTTKHTPTSPLFLLSADGVTLLRQMTKNRVKLSSLGMEICFITCSSLQGGERSSNQAAIAYTEDGENWILGIYLGSELGLNNEKKLHFATWSPADVAGLLEPSLPPFFGMKNSDDFMKRMQVCSKVIDGKVDCIFLSQVSGVRSGSRKLEGGLLNINDLCVQCSKNGPDKLLHFSLPSKGWRNRIEEKQLTFIGIKNMEVLKKLSRPVRRARHKKVDSVPGMFTPSSNYTMDHLPTKVILARDHAYRTRVEPDENKYFTVPYLTSVGEFASLTKESLRELLMYDGRLTPDEHDAMVRLLSCACFFLVIHDMKLGPVRIAVAPEETFDRSEEGVSVKVGNIELRVVEAFQGGNHQLPLDAILISRWSAFPYLDPIPIEVADGLISCYTPSGHGRRSRTGHVGQCIFQGRRSKGTRAQESLEQGPKELGEFQLCRKTYIHSLIPMLESLTSILSEQAMNAAMWLDTIPYKYLKNVMGHNFCRIKIVSQGVPGKIWSYANSSHVDSDTPAKDVARELEESTPARNEFETCDLLDQKCDYLRRWLQLKGSPCVPTSCCWTLIGDFAKLGSNVEVFAYFIFKTLGTAIRIRDRTGQVFYASMAVHNTAVMVVVAEGKVQYKSNESCRMFAWGKSGS